MLKKLILLFLVVFAIKGCTKDDICPPGTPTTPLLIVTFKDIINSANSKEVIGLSVTTDYDDPILILATTTTDSIAIPLSTASDTTKYKFIKTTITETDTTENVDKVMFIYNRRNSYENRACGFKTEFDNLRKKLEEEGIENWIDGIIVVRDTVNDENEAHINILH